MVYKLLYIVDATLLYSFFSLSYDRHLLFLQLKMVDLQSSEADLAKSALFTKHPEMKGKLMLVILQYAERLSTFCY